VTVGGAHATPVVRTVDHVTVAAPRPLETAVVEWYAQTLGLERLDKPEGTSSSGAWFRAGAVQIHVTIEPEPAERVGHFGLVVEDFDAVVEHLRATGSDIEAARTIPGRSRCYTRDPAGNKIEILAYDGGPSA
jgi:catechol 2,3-dioxygenase-like lactoylglutathione lyase family enzyme